MMSKPATGARQLWLVGGTRCPICAIPISWPQAHVYKTCGGWECHAAYCQRLAQENRRREREHRQRCQERLAQVLAVRDAVSRDEQVADAANYVPVSIPVNDRPIVALSPQRRHEFAEQLAILVERTEGLAAGQSPVEAPPSVVAAPLPVLHAACATCGGACCVRGGTHAYLNESVIERYWASRPDADAAQIVRDYCRHLPQQTYEGSCVFHSAAGCSLPRAMRSATCLSFVCSGYVEVHERVVRDRETRFFLAAADGDQLVRWAFVEQPPTQSPSLAPSDLPHSTACRENDEMRTGPPLVSSFPGGAVGIVGRNAPRCAAAFEV